MSTIDIRDLEPSLINKIIVSDDLHLRKTESNNRSDYRSTEFNIKSNTNEGLVCVLQEEIEDLILALEKARGLWFQ